MSSIEREYTTEQATPNRPGIGPQASEGRSWDADGTGRRDHKPFFLTSEFFVMGSVVAAILIAAAVAGNFHAPRAWTLIAVMASAYIVSRGISKIGRGDGPFFNRVAR
jgi:hypothetical protein